MARNHGSPLPPLRSKEVARATAASRLGKSLVLSLAAVWAVSRAKIWWRWRVQAKNKFISHVAKGCVGEKEGQGYREAACGQLRGRGSWMSYSNGRTITFSTLCWCLWLLPPTHNARPKTAECCIRIQIHFSAYIFPWPLYYDISYLGIYGRPTLCQGTPDPPL